MRFIKQLSTILILAASLAACAPSSKVIATQIAIQPTAALNTAVVAMITPTQPPAVSQPTVVQAAEATPTTAAPAVTLNCAAAFEHRELSAPYKRDKYTQAQRFTYSTEELNNILAEINIASMCIPVELGAPYLGVDWNAAKKSAQEGRMVVINFETPDPQSPYARGMLVYSTYNIQVGTEYDKYVLPEDYQAVKTGTMPGLFEANGLKGFARVQPSAFSFGTTTLFQVYAIPFDWGYVALVYPLGAYEGDLKPLIDRFQAGDYPSEMKPAVTLFGEMAKTVKLRTLSQ